MPSRSSSTQHEQQITSSTRKHQFLRLSGQLIFVSHGVNASRSSSLSPRRSRCWALPTEITPPSRSKSLGICRLLRPQSHVCHLPLAIRTSRHARVRTCILPALYQRNHVPSRARSKNRFSYLPILPKKVTSSSNYACY